MRELKYVAHDGTVIDLDTDDLWVPHLQDMRGSAWSTTLSTRGLKTASRVASATKMSVQSTDPETLDRLMALADFDVQAMTPGTLTVNGEWTQRAYLTGLTVSTVPMPGFAQADITVVLCDGVWRRRLETQAFNPLHVDSGTSLDMPYDLPSDLASPKLIQRVSNPGILPAEFTCRIFGQATNPSFQLGGNVYRLNDLTVPAGAYLEIVARSDEKSIVLHAADGGLKDCFANGERGSGRDGGTYIFQPIPAGETILSWSGAFGIEFDLFQTSGGVPWSTLS